MPRTAPTACTPATHSIASTHWAWSARSTATQRRVWRPRVLTGGHSRGHQATFMEGASGAALLHLGDLLVTHAHLPPAWVSALDDFPLDTIRAKRAWLARPPEHGWWVAFSHDVNNVAATLDAEGKPHKTWLPRVH